MKIALDLEFTGLDQEYDEILSIAIVDENMEPLFYSLVRPENLTEWPETVDIHGISPEMVSGCKTISELRDEISAIIARAEVLVFYNDELDIRFLEKAGIKIGSEQVIFDITRVGRGRGFFRRKKLSQCAKFFEYKPENDFHNALEDANFTSRLEETFDGYYACNMYFLRVISFSGEEEVEPIEAECNQNPEDILPFSWE